MLGGCGGDPNGHNEADVEFASDVAAHHAQTVHLVNLTLGRPSVGGGVSRLADQARMRRLTEIDDVSRWLTSWNQKVPETGLEHRDEGKHVAFDASIPGVLTSAQTKALASHAGPGFRAAWLDRLIAHERGAIEIASAEVEQGQNARAVAFAKKDRAAHRAQLADLKRLLKR
jgi:uncharacterized protein (DUF305 family)